MEFDHLSASQINKWIEDPALWILDKIYKVPAGRMPAAWRGQAVEKAVDYMLMAEDFELGAMIKLAQADFLECDWKTGEPRGMESDAEYGKIEDYVAVAAEAVDDRGWGPPEKMQSEVKKDIEGVEVLQYHDYTYPGFVRDLKTAGRAPGFGKESGLLLKPDHLRQMAIYTHDTNQTAQLLYITPKKYILYEPTKAELNWAWGHVCAAVRAMKSFDGDIERYVPRDFSNFWWDDNLRAKARELWQL